jgi:hypothetical protein
MDTNFGVIFEEFLGLQEWNKEKVEFDVDKNEYSVVTTVGAKGQPVKLFIEGDQDNFILRIFFYYNFNVRDSQRGEMALLLNWINCTMAVGHFQCIHDHVRWVQNFDCEGTALSAETVSVNMQHGWSYIDRFMEPIASVALTRTSAEAAIEKFKADLQSADDDGVPDEV